MIKRPKANIQDSSPMYGFDPKIGFWGLRNLKHKAYFDYEIENPIDVYHNGEGLREDDFKSIIWNSWVKPLIFLEYLNFTLTIETPSELVKNRIDNHKKSLYIIQNNRKSLIRCFSLPYEKHDSRKSTNI